MNTFFLLVLPILIFGKPIYTNYPVQEDYIPILGYHRIGDRNAKTSITYERFHEQIKYLTETFRCNWLSMNDLAHHIENKEKLPTNACILNFDDGAASQLFSMCSLNKYKIPATFYIPDNNLANETQYTTSTDWITRYIELNGIDKHDYNMYPQELELISSWGHDIQAHTLTHADLSTLNYTEQWKEIYGSIIELQERGYQITSFAYPFGNYDETTIKIMEKLFNNGDLVLGRNTEKKEMFRDMRSAVFNISHKYSYNYIKPELFTGEELAKKIAYTYWWQFEENYKLYNESYDVFGVQKDKVSSSSAFTPVDGFAILALYQEKTSVETTFATKYQSGITIDIYSFHDGIGTGYYIEIDGKFYSPEKHNEDSDLYMTEKRGWGTKEGFSQFTYYNYYINIPNLSSGVHTMRIYKNTAQKVYLDKFRVFSKISQEFRQSYGYGYECLENDPNCNCDYNEDKPSKRWRLNISEMTMVLIVCILVGSFSICLCMNTGSNREFKKYGHIKNQRDLLNQI